MFIRKATISDIPSILSIYNYEVLNSTSTFDICPKTAEYFLKFFDAHGERYPIYIVEESIEKIVGWGCLSKFSDKEGYKFTVENSIYIHHLYRNQGYGKLLLQYLIDKAKELEFKNIVSRICSENQASIYLHQSLGFIEVGKLKNVGYKFDRFLDVVILQLTL